MSATLTIASANFFTGISGDVTRVASISNARLNDKQRELWLKYILPPLVTEDFIRSVMTSDAFMRIFKFQIPADVDTSIPWNTYSHVVAYQNLAQAASVRVPLRLVPWQLRFEFAPETHSRLLTTVPSFDEELEGVFKSAGWHFWRTDTGFCIAPLELYLELKNIHTTYEAWRNLQDIRGAGFTDFATETNDESKNAIQLPDHMGGSNAAAGSALGRSSTA
jgi:hypothetical protein